MVLNVNKDFFSGKTVEEINNKFQISKKSIANNLQEALIHESNHAKLIKGKSIQEIQELYSALSQVHINGISATAYSDGVEALAEIEVLLYRGNTVTGETLDLYYKYMR